ncbi:hypothetical protein J437_LFUL009995 [Ladona fulva]|uniref:Down syndrome cell adhesion molecule-like protein Dscam2 n=1 Tax=Ladona fulva TaxID=123851 RepID=A0A8K0P3V8_LADFU|nr:hypothetical protein J437_LFUL009995 [Ladona fulva]
MIIFPRRCCLSENLTHLGSFTGNRELPVDLRQKVYPNGTLSVEHVQKKTDAGVYTCTARNKQGHSARRSGEVTVIVPPKISPFHVDRSLHLGERATFTCSVTKGDVPLSVSWLKDGSPIPSSSSPSASSSSPSSSPASSTSGISVSHVDQFNSILLIESLSPRHNGNYSCVAQNLAATVSHTQELMVNVPPIIEPFSFQEGLSEGMRSRTVCGVSQGDPPLTITWLKDGLPLFGGVVGSGSSPSPSSSLPLSSTLLPGVSAWPLDPYSSLLNISSLSSSHSGEYTCVASNRAAEVRFKARLQVKVPPRWLVEPEDTSVARNKNVVLQCQADGVPKPTIVWKKATEPWSSAIEIEIPVGGSDSNTGQGSHHGWQPPQGPWSPVSTNSGLGQWYHKRIDSLRPATRYSFRVASEGAGGRGTYGEVLEVRTEPQRPSAPPRNAILHPLSSTSLRLSWNAPPIDAWHGDVHAYTVGIRDASSGSTHYNFSTYPVEDVEDDSDDELDNDRKAGGRGIGLDIGPESTWEANLRQPQYEQHLTGGSGYHFSLILSGLRPFSRYAAVVQAVNQVGAGPLSEPAEAQTLEDVPSMPPQDVRCAALTPQSLQVSWQPPPSAHAHGIIRGYKLTYEPADEVLAGEDIWETKKTTALTTVLSGLQRFANYSLRVAAFTGVGDGAAAPPIHCRTDEDVPGPPADIKVVVSSPQSLLVSWLPPKEPNGIITKYNLYNRVVDGSGVIGRGMGDGALGVPVGAGGQQGKRSLPGTHTSFEAKGLTPRVEHSFWVTATTRAGEGRSTRVASLMPTPRG